MIIKATSHTIKNIWLFILFIFLIFIALLGTLIHGISIESIVLPKLKIEQLYIKLDKKLIVSIEQLQIDKTTQNDSSLEESAFIIEHFALLNQLFKTIHIKKLAYQNETFEIDFSNDIFFLQSSHLDTRLHFNRTGMHQFDISLFDTSLKDMNLTLDGKLSIDLQKKHYVYEGNYNLFGIKGISIIEHKDAHLTYHVQSEVFDLLALSSLMNFISPKVGLDPLIKTWIHENIVASSYALHFLEGHADIETGEYFPLDIRAHATVKDANVSFAPSVPPAHIQEIGILLEKDDLVFEVKEAVYEKKPIEKAEVRLYKLVEKGTGILVNLFATAPLDDTIHKILHAFKIVIPIHQTSGSIKSNVNLDIKFLPFDVNATGTFVVLPSDFLLNNLKMHADYGKILLDNRLVYLENAHMQYASLFDINATGIFDTSADQFNGKIDINALNLNFGDVSLLTIHNLPEQEAFLRIDKNGTHMELPAFHTRMQFGTQENTFAFNDISKLTAYSALMHNFGTLKGDASVFTKDFETFEASASLFNLTTPFIKNGSPLTALEFNLTTDTKTLKANTSDNALSLHYDGNLSLHVKDMNLSIAKEQTTKTVPITLKISGENASFEIENSTKSILSDRFSLLLKGDDLYLDSRHKKTQFEVDTKKNMLALNSQSMDDNFTNALLGNHYFYEGDFSLQMEGKSFKENNSTFILQKTYIKDLKFFNNLMATINTIPSLLVFSDPNFNKEGYFVKDGYIEFEQNDTNVTLHELNLKGSSADIFGSGSVNLKDDTLHLELQIRTLQTFSSAIDFIPVVGEVILGEDKRISTHITVTGPISDPKIETHLVKDTLMSPVNIIKRTIELPLELFK